MHKRITGTGWFAAMFACLFVAGCAGDVSRYEGEAPPMDSGMGFNADMTTFCTTDGLVAYKVKMHEKTWRLATSAKYNYPESRVRVLFSAYALLQEYIAKGEQAGRMLKNSTRCRGASRPTDSGLEFAEQPRLCRAAGLLEAKLSMYKVTWRAVTDSMYRDIPKERVKLLFDADAVLREKLAEIERAHHTVKNLTRCQG